MSAPAHRGIDAVVYSGAAVPAQPPDKQVTSDSGVAPESTSSLVTRSVHVGPEDEFADADAVIRHHCENEWSDDFSMRADCIRQQREAVAKLKLGRPQDVPDEMFSRIRRRCAAEWPDDYAMRVYCEEQQFAGYRQVREK